MCFSPTGTTRKIVTKIANQVGKKIEVEQASLDFTLPDARTGILSFTADDLVIFGTPVYAGRVPNVLLKYLETIQGNGAISVPVVLFGNRNYDDALIELRDVMDKREINTVAAGAFVGEHSFSKLLARHRPDEADMTVAQNFAMKIVDKLEAIDVSPLPPIHVKGAPSPYRGYYQPRDPQGSAVDIRKVKPLTSVDCINCRVCAEVCPMGSVNRHNVSEITGICIKCGACIKKCPVNAKYYEDAAFLYHQHELEEELTRRAEPELFL